MGNGADAFYIERHSDEFFMAQIFDVIKIQPLQLGDIGMGIAIADALILDPRLPALVVLALQGLLRVMAVPATQVVKIRADGCSIIGVEAVVGGTVEEEPGVDDHTFACGRVCLGLVFGRRFLSTG